VPSRYAALVFPQSSGCRRVTKKKMGYLIFFVGTIGRYIPVPIGTVPPTRKVYKIMYSCIFIASCAKT